MKKIFVIFALLMFLLAACASEPAVPATEPPSDIVFATPDASLASSTVGFATVRRIDGMQALLLRSKPDNKSRLAGRVNPGEQGKLLGLDPTGSWALVKFSEQSGWAPVQALDLLVAQ